MSTPIYVHPRPGGGTVTLVSRVGSAAGSRAAAAALACAGSEPDRAGLSIDLADGRPPRPSLVASAAARRLEERLVAHMPEAAVASRGRICRLALPADPSGVERIAAALPLARDSAVAVHLPPHLFRAALEEPRVRASGVLLRADLGAERSLAALIAAELVGSGLRVAVLKRPLGWTAARLALAGVPPGAAGGLSPRLTARLLGGRADTVPA